MSGETTTSVGPSTSFYAVQHELAGVSGQPDETSATQEIDPALEEKRRKARERQRRKRERDRASSAHRAPTLTGTASETMNDAEARRAEVKKIKARERQRKHRELMKARKNQETSPLVREPSQSHIVPVEPPQERASVAAPPPPSNPPQAQPNQPSVVEAPPSAPTHQAVPQEITYTERSSATSQSVASSASVPPRVPAAFLDRGDFFANALLSAVTRLPEIRNHLFEALRMTEDDLMSFRAILSAQFNHWDDQRIRIAHTIAGNVSRIAGASEGTLLPPRSSWASAPASTSQTAVSSSSNLQPHPYPHPITPLTPPSQPRTPGDANPSSVRRSVNTVSHAVATAYAQAPQQAPNEAQPQWKQQPSSAHGTAPATPHQPARSSTQDHPTIQTTAPPTSTVQSHPPPQHPPPQMQFVQHGTLAAQQQHQSLRTYHPSTAPTESQIPHSHSHSHSHNQSAYTSTSPVVLHSRGGAVHPSVGPARVHHEQQDKSHRHQPY